jgi:hypothetical protein
VAYRDNTFLNSDIVEAKRALFAVMNAEKEIGNATAI